MTKLASLFKKKPALLPEEHIGTCMDCGKEGLPVSKRSFIHPLVSPKPIVSVNELCRDCFDRIKEKSLQGVKDMTPEQMAEAMKIQSPNNSNHA